MNRETAEKIKKEKPELCRQLLDGTLSGDDAAELTKYIRKTNEENDNDE